MGVDSKHPFYDEHRPDLQQMRETYRGERIVKQAAFRYLPATAGMIADGLERPEQKGFKAYDAYRKRSRFPDLVREAVEALLGVMHHKPATIELPEKMEFMREDATARNESLQMFLRRINEEQLVTGRAGLLADVADKGERKDKPYLVINQGETVINWDEGRSDGIEVQNLNFVSIDETENERIGDFEWEEQQKFRVLLLLKDETDEAAVAAVQGPNARGTGTGEGGEEPVMNLPEGEGVYRMGVFRENNTTFTPSRLITPSIRGETLNKIPFVFVNTKDITPEPDDPPLLGLSNLTLAIYCGEADYRQALFLQGQDTLVVIGATDDEEHRVGAGASINLPQSADAKFIGVDSSGLSEMRLSLENDYTRAGAKGGQLLDTVGGDQQSGEALRVRVAAKTATLNQIALAGAFALESLLKIVAEWLKLDPEQVVVAPNLDFVDDQISGQQVVEFMTAKSLGAPISLESIHKQLQDRGFTELSFQEEVDKIVAEAGLELGGGGSTAEDGPEDDGDQPPPGDGEDEDGDEDGEDEPDESEEDEGV